MILFSHEDVHGFYAAARGMRMSYGSMADSDTLYPGTLGEKDATLMRKLAGRGTDEAKFLRVIHVSCDIMAPMYWWKQFDTYKVGTVRLSSSTMHTLLKVPFRPINFGVGEYYNASMLAEFRRICVILNAKRQRWLELQDPTEKQDVWKEIIMLLPESYMQTSTVDLNYQVLQAMYHARKNHKLEEWHDFCEWCESLPYFKEICV